MARFVISADLLKAIAKLYAEIGSIVYLVFTEGVARFITLDASKTVAVVTEVEPSIVFDEEESKAAFDADYFKRVANALKHEELSIEMHEDKIVISAEGDYTKRFELPITTEEPPKLSRAILLERIKGKYTCEVVITAEFMREAINVLKKTLKPDTVTISVESSKIVITAPAALHKSEIIGMAGSSNVQDIECTESVTLFFPFEPLEAFAKSIKGAVVRLYLGPEIPLVMDAELTAGANVLMVVTPRHV